MTMRSTFLAAFMALFLCVPPATAENSTADFLVQIGIREMEHGNYKGAAHEFSKALLLEPHNAAAHRYLIQLGHPGGIYPAIQQTNDQLLQMHKLYGAARTWEEDVREMRRVDAQGVFRMERMKYENDKDRGSHLRDYPHLGREGIRHVSDSLATTTRPLPKSDRVQRRRPTYPILEGDAWQAQTRQSVIERYLDIHETEQTRFPNRVIRDPGPASSPVEAQKDFYDLQGMIDYSRQHELAFFYWLDDEPKSSYEIQFEHQDQLITVLDEYLGVREAQLQEQQDALLGTELELLQTEMDLAYQVEANNDLHNVYHQVVRRGDDQAYYVAQENSYMQFLEGKLTAVRDELSEHADKVEEQEVLVASLEAELETYRQQVDELLAERENLLKDVSHRVDELQRIGDRNIRP